MELHILAVGDVVGASGLDYLRRHLPALKKLCHADLTVVNGENASMTGLTPAQADAMLDAGADVVTLGNHTWNRREICTYLDDCPNILRPANFAPQLPGRGWGVFTVAGREFAVVNLIGRCEMNFVPDNPFTKIDGILEKIEKNPTFVDFHAEATSEKLAMAYMLDGRVSAVWGTHTHVPTADAGVLPRGTGHVTDLGMTGPAVSVLGVKPEQSIAMFRGELTSRFEQAAGKCSLQAVLFTVESATNLCTKAERVDIYD